MSEREYELQGAIQSVLTDARYALGQLASAADSGDCKRKDQDRIIRAIDGLERIVANAESALAAAAETA